MKKIIYLIACVMISVSCGDFLKEYSKELTYASSCSDLDEILIGNGYMKSETSNTIFSGGKIQDGSYYYSWLQVMDDDLEEYATGKYSETSLGTIAMVLRPFYTWQAKPFQNIQGVLYDDPNWKKLYEHIGYLNVIISQVDEFGDEPLETRNRIKGEAEFLRGANYLLLVNMYAKPYVKATAATDPGVVLNITEDIDGGYVNRASVKRVYEQIVEDLKNAADHLSGVEQSTIYRVNERAVRILLSRVYLYMGEWQAAIDECNKAITAGCPLWDLNEWDMTEVVSETRSDNWNKMQYMLTEESPEVLFTQGVNIASRLMWDAQTSSRYRVSDELVGLYSKYEGQGKEDLRLKGYFSVSQISSKTYLTRKNSVDVTLSSRVFDLFTIRTAEAYLNKAEAEAILGKAEATATLKVLMQKRFREGELPSTVDELSGSELVKLVREERRRELCFECHRWFDLRRYAVCSEYPDVKGIKHNIYSQASTAGVAGVYAGYYELGSYADEPASYTLFIPDYEITYNKGEMVQNEERENHIVIE